MGRNSGKRGANPSKETMPKKRKSLRSTQKEQHSNNGGKVNRNKEDGQTLENDQNNSATVTSAVFSKDEQMMEMEVNAIQQENEFPEENEEAESGIVQLRIPSGSLVNNKAGIDAESEDGELKRDDEDEEFQKEKDRFKEEFLDDAMNRFQDIFMSSEFMQTTVDMVKRNIAKETAGNQSYSRGQHGEDTHRANKKAIDTRVDRSRNRPSQGKNSMNVDLEQILSKASVSELTVYKNAVEDHINKRDSSSSDEVINTSDEIEIEGQNFVDGSNLFKDKEKVSQVTDSHDMINDFIAEVRERQRTGTYANDGEIPGTSSGHGRNQPQAAQHRFNPEDKAKDLIRNAEMGRARIHETPGKCLDHSDDLSKVRGMDLTNNFVHSAMVDESYQLVASHVDELTQEKIIKGDYVDFGCLVPRDRILIADDNRFEMVVKEGKTYWVPAGNHELASISNYN